MGDSAFIGGDGGRFHGTGGLGRYPTINGERAVKIGSAIPDPGPGITDKPPGVTTGGGYRFPDIQRHCSLVCTT